MVPKLHAKGSSFKGAAAYVLHDKDRATSSDRVGFTETRNLAADDPDMAWRIMAATALDQARLKAQAGVKNTGRKSNKHVLHLTLNWHPNQTPSRQDMLDAADGALRSLGAEKHQALIVSHTDEAHPHLHIVLNRVSPIDGRHLSSSKEKLMLSKWAQDYEERTGVFCENRIVNNEQRERGEYVRGKKDQARHIYEAQAANLANDNDRDQALVKTQKAKDHALALRGRNMAKQHKAAWESLERSHGDRKASALKSLKKQIAKARAAIVEDMRPDWRALHRRQDKERKTFESMETSFFGRASNMVRTVRMSRKAVIENESGIIRRTFGILTNAGKRKEYFEAAQQRDRSALERRQAEKVSEAARSLKTAHRDKIAALTSVFFKERTTLEKRQENDRAHLKDAWRNRTAQRMAAYEARSDKRRQADALLDRYDMAAKQKPPARSDEQKNALLSKYGSRFSRAARPKAAEQDNNQKPKGDSES